MSQGDSREEIFNAGKSHYDKRTSEKEKKVKGDFAFIKIDFAPLGKDKENFKKNIRILNNPLVANKKRNLPTDAKLIVVSDIVGDDGKKFKCVWPEESEHPNWILWKVYRLVMKSKWNKEEGKFIPVYKDIHPDIFERVTKNGINKKLPYYKYEAGWKPKNYVLLNVLDRDNMKWHKENKKAMILSRNAFTIKTDNSEDEPIVFYDYGIPEYCYNTIWKNVCEARFDTKMELIFDYDIRVEKLDKDPYYSAAYLDSYPLTEEEKGWELWDFDKFFKISTYTKIRYKLGSFINEIDKTFGTKFSEELDELVEKEREEREKLEESSPEEKVVSKEVEEKEKPVSRKKVESKEETPVNYDEIRKFYPHFSKLKDEWKKLVKGLDENNKIIWDTTKNIKMATCIKQRDGCDCTSPIDFTFCIKCGTEFIE